MIGLLLDTHAFLWLSNDDPKLPQAILRKLDNYDTPVYLSHASAWEIAIKHGKGRLESSIPFEKFVFDEPANRGIQMLRIEQKHLIRYNSLGFPDPNHSDPFDRMLVAQTLENGSTLVSRDSKLDIYGIQRLWI